MIPNPQSTGFDPTNALTLARLAKLAYAELGETESAWMDRVGRTMIGLNGRGRCEWRFLSARETDTQGFVVATTDTLVIVFRGTSPTKLRDWLTDLDARKAGEVWGEVHHGFAEAFDSIAEQLVDAFRALVPDGSRIPVWLTGHSLGGALATLASPVIGKIHRELPRGIVFGSPRVGDAGWRGEFNTLFEDRFWRVQMAGDPVPWVPGWLLGLGFKHAGQEAFIDDGRLLMNPSPWRQGTEAVQRMLAYWPQRRLALLPNHFMDRYVAALEALNHQDTKTPS